MGDNTENLVDGMYSFRDLVDIGRLRTMFESFSEATGFTTGLVSFPDQELLFGTGWRDTCTKFHRAFPVSEIHCKKSNTELTGKLKNLKEMNIRHCENGLVDGATPIIVDGVHIANLATGQILFEEPDLEWFRKHGEACGYDVPAYLEAVKKVPVVTEEAFRKALTFLCEMAVMLAEQSLAELRNRLTTRRVEESEENLRITLNSIGDAVVTTDTEGLVVRINPVAERLTGWKAQEAEGRHLADIFHIVNAQTGKPALDPVRLALETGSLVGLANHTLLIARDGREYQIADSAAPIRNNYGNITGVVLVFRDATEEFEMQNSLKKSEQRFRSTVESSPAGMHFYNLMDDGHLVFSGANKAADKILGVDNSIFIGKTIEDAFPLLTHTEIPDRYRKVASNGELWTTEQVEYDGNDIKGVFEVTAFRTEPGRMAAMFFDISERKRAEAALRKNQQYMESIFRAAPTGIGVVIDRVFRQVNEQLCAMTGYSEKELIGRNARMIYPSDEDYDYVGREKYMQIRDHGTGTVETRWQRKDGRIIDVLLSSTPIDLHDLSKGVTFTALDITNRKRAIEALRLNESRLDALINLGQMTSASLKELTDFAIEKAIELTGSTIGYLAFMSEDETILTMYSWSQNAMKECIINDKPIVYPVASTGLWGEAVRQRKPVITNDYTAPNPLKKGYPEGHVPVTRHMNIPVFDGGRIVAVAGVGNKEGEYNEGDVRQLTLLMEGMWRLVRRMQADREKENLQAQLNQAQKMESVGRLAGGVAHDFNNMLGVILGLTEMALENVDQTQSLHNDLLEIHKAAARSADLTRQLLTFARKQTIAPRVLDLNDTVGGMLKMLQRLIGEDIDLDWRPGEGVWPVKMDPTQIDQILANLCVNARDAISGVGRITIETENSVLYETCVADQAGPVSGEFVLMIISDNGCGMNQETLSHIYEPFFTTKEMGVGTGLGLATIYGIVRQNEGFINVFSEPGHGTTFKIYLPRHSHASERPPEKGVTPAAARGHETVLLVENEPAILKMTARMLEDQGYTVLAAGTPGEAVDYAREHAGDIHLLITDVVMPEMNGRDLAKNLLSLYPNLRRLFMSGYTVDVIAHRGVLEEGVHFVQKPFSVKDLAEKVREALGND